MRRFIRCSTENKEFQDMLYKILIETGMDHAMNSEDDWILDDDDDTPENFAKAALKYIGSVIKEDDWVENKGEYFLDEYGVKINKKFLKEFVDAHRSEMFEDAVNQRDEWALDF